MTSCFFPSKSIAERRTMRSETFAEDEVEEEEEREIRDLEKKERDERRGIWDESLWRFATAIVVFLVCVNEERMMENLEMDSGFSVRAHSIGSRDSCGNYYFFGVVLGKLGLGLDGN